MPEPERSIEELVEELSQSVFGVAISTERRTFNEDTLARAERARIALLRAVARLREERDAAYDALTQLQSALTPKGGDRE